MSKDSAIARGSSSVDFVPGTKTDGTFLGHLTCADIPRENETPMTLESDMTPTEAFRALAQSWVRASPVRKAGTQEIIGTLDLQDACRYLVDLHKAAAKNKQTQSRKRRLSWIAEHPQIKAAADAGKGNIEELAKKRPFKTFKPSEPLAQVSQALGAGSHIVGIVDEESGSLVHIVTQGVLIRLLAPLLKKITLPVMVVMKSPVISVRAEDTASEAFEVISGRNISGLAVLDEDGGVVDNCSITDVKMLISAQDDATSEVSLLQMTHDFLKHHRSIQASKMGKAKLPVAKCGKADKLHQAVAKLVRTGYHHIWVVDEGVKTPLGVVSLTDIFKTLPSLDLEGSNAQLAAKSKSKSCAIL
uniref:CBS domain-containing protein n=1 Tax=Hemiselmis tepida TaxID=464990 RepID=A0A7S0WAG3_9CRYP